MPPPPLWMWAWLASHLTRFTLASHNIGKHVQSIHSTIHDESHLCKHLHRNIPYIPRSDWHRPSGLGKKRGWRSAWHLLIVHTLCLTFIITISAQRKKARTPGKCGWAPCGWSASCQLTKFTSILRIGSGRRFFILRWSLHCPEIDQ